ncbi:DUF4153 domain-containing protein [Streptomyces sp. NPDC048825]|uniref:DUF4153 domain-containing protein n=1 Tax=Streptomyces sp. NPDC048825 TaxID=3365592 RepID=UPI003714B5F6
MSDTPSEAEPRKPGADVGGGAEGSAGEGSGGGGGAVSGRTAALTKKPAVAADEPEDAVPASYSGDAASEGDADGDDRGRGDVDWGYPVAESAWWFADLQAKSPAPVRPATLWASLATGVLSMLLLGDGLALNLLLVAIPAALAAYYAAQAAGRGPRRWTLVWGVGGLALLAVPALRDADWPTFLAVVTAVAAGSLALHGGRTWTGVLFGPIGLYTSVLTGPVWGWRGLRERFGGARGNLGPVLRALAVAAVLLLVFGALFAGADAAFADLLGGLMPDTSVSGGPWHLVLLVLGLVGALAAAHTAASPVQWDCIEVPPGRERGRVEWALPLIVLVVLFAAFNAVQLAVLFGGYDTVLEKTGQSYAEYARQGFWQLLLVTLLTLLVIVFALRWAPRNGARDWTLVRAVLGTLCVLTLVVVASAVRRMDMYVEAYGLTRLRISVVTVELWLALVIVLIMAAGVWGARWLPRAVMVSAAAGVLAFGLLSPDGLVAERNVERYEATSKDGEGKFDVDYARGLSADAVPALDKLEEPLRSCVLEPIARELKKENKPWYATSWGEARARGILEDRPLSAEADWSECLRLRDEFQYR